MKAFKLLLDKSKKKNNQKGYMIIGYIIVYPFLVLFFMYLVLAGAYFMKQNDMANIANKHLDMALVEGRFTQEIFNKMEEELEDRGFKSENYIISINNPLADPRETPEDVYVTRGNVIELVIIHQKPHPFYYINKAMLWSVQPETFYITSSISGMSEKW